MTLGVASLPFLIMSRSPKASRLRSLLSRYKGGRFEVGGSGGAAGMVFFIDQEGKSFYIGGFTRDADVIVEALNLTMELLEGSASTANPRSDACPRT